LFSSAPICADGLQASGALRTVTELLDIHKEFALEVEDLVSHCLLRDSLLQDMLARCCETACSKTCLPIGELQRKMQEFALDLDDLAESILLLR
jgi:hypothetical protein